MIIYYDILAPFEQLGIGGREPIETPQGRFYSFGVRDYALDAINLCNRLNEGSKPNARRFRTASFDHNGFNRWINGCAKNTMKNTTNGKENDYETHTHL